MEPKNEKKLFIGMDIHKRSWRVHFKTDISDHKGMTMPPNSHKLWNYVEENFQGFEVSLTYEAGCCGFSAAREFLNMGWQVMVVNPADIPRVNKDQYQKTDTIDAHKLSKLLKENQLKPIHIPSEEEDSMKVLLRHRDQVVKNLRRVKQHIKSVLAYVGIQIPEEYDNANWSRNFIQWLKTVPTGHNLIRKTLDSKILLLESVYKEYLEIANTMRKYCRTNHKEDYYLLKSIPGIGGYLAAAILSDIGDLRRFSNESQLASYIGIIPGVYSSGGTENKFFITPRCRSLVRSYLIEASWVALRHDPELQAYYRKHIGKNPKSIIVKIAHKLVRRILSVIKNKQPYQVNYHVAKSETKK